MGELRGQKGRVWSIFILSGHLWSKMTSFFFKSIIPLLNYISRYTVMASVRYHFTWHILCCIECHKTPPLLDD